MITKLLSGLPSRTMDQTTFDAAMAQVMSDLPTWGTEVNATAASMNSAAAGTVYALPFVFDTATANADPGSGKLRLNAATQNTATAIYIDLVGTDTVDYTAFLDQMDASTSSVKGRLLLYKQGDKTKFLMFDLTARTANTGYRALTVTLRASSAANPFANGDALILAFERTGDKGDTPSLVTGVLHVRDEKTNTTPGGTATGTTLTRTLNTVKKNSITGASLASNQITLPAGTYRIQGNAPAFLNAPHQAQLYNVTDAAIAAVGSSERANGTVQTRSFVGPVEIVIAAQKVFELRHWTSGANTTNDLGQPASSGQVEVYSELFVEKLA